MPTKYPTGTKLWDLIHGLPQIKEAELEGFQRGEKKGKTMNGIHSWSLLGSLLKAMDDLKLEWDKHPLPFLPEEAAIIKTKIADVRNVAGCLFLKVLEENGE